MLYSGSFKDIDCDKYDGIWLIVRSLKSVPAGNNIYHVPQLSPSPDLFHKYLSLREAGKWNTKAFDEIYTPQFLKEMQSPEAFRYLNILANKAKTKDILIACYCKDERMCHRSLVKKCIFTFQKDFYLLIAGSRGYNNYDEMKEKTDYILSHKIAQGYCIHIVSGGARGADSLAKRYAQEHGYQYHEFPADWHTYGKSAGYVRNREMHVFISQFPFREVLCFWDGKSKGTAHNFELCKSYNNPLRIYKYQA